VEPGEDFIGQSLANLYYKKQVQASKRALFSELPKQISVSQYLF